MDNSGICGKWGYAISVSNEPDNAFEEDKELVDRMLNFFEPVRGHIHEIDKNVGVSITMNTGGFLHSKKQMKKIMKAVDFGCFNFYGGGFEAIDRPFTAGEIQENFKEMMAFAGSKNVVIQEFGMHADHTLLNSSEEVQRQFFQTFFEMMEKEPRLKAAYIFQMVDWSPLTVDIINTSFEADTPQLFIDQYGLILKTLGLIEFETGRSKLAWDEVIAWIEKFN